jgi:histone H3/H4
MSDKEFAGTETQVTTKPFSRPKHANNLQAVTSSPCPEVCAASKTRTTTITETDKDNAATVQKIITEVLAGDQGMSFAKETRDLLIECCVEFITMISSEANEIAEKDAKKTIACEHIVKALEELGFNEYVPDLLEVAQQFKSQQAVSLDVETQVECEEC